MAGELFLPPTGNDIVDELRGVQLIADTIDDPNVKIRRVRDTVRLVAAHQLLGRQLMVDASTIYAHAPSKPSNEQYRFQGLLFIARLNIIGYMLDEDLPVDSLTLNFEAPEVIGVLPEESPSFEILTFQVPVLSIDSCLLAEAA